SALLALLHDEPGGEAVRDLLEGAAISSVNWTEVLQKALERQTEIEGLREDLEALGLRVLPFSAAQAEQTARFRAQTRAWGLSLGDRACLALAADLKVPAVTADRVWSEIPLGVEIRVVR
ncbi:MAG TPA: type II toxin-antitoxin system VapC family toxin, partial [Thermoanaerobaculia bacterium]